MYDVLICFITFVLCFDYISFMFDDICFLFDDICVLCWTDNFFQIFFMGTSWVSLSIKNIKTRASREMTWPKISNFSILMGWTLPNTGMRRARYLPSLIALFCDVLSLYVFPPPPPCMGVRGKHHHNVPEYLFSNRKLELYLLFAPVFLSFTVRICYGNGPLNVSPHQTGNMCRSTVADFRHN